MTQIDLDIADITRLSLVKGLSGPLGSVGSFLKEKELDELTARTKEGLISLVQKAVSLRRSEVITEEQFVSIISYICSIYVEKEVTERINKVIGDQLYSILKR